MSLGSYVQDVPGYLSRGNFSFEKTDCEQWVNNTNFNSSVYASCDALEGFSGMGPGMTLIDGSVLSFSCPDWLDC